jgi:hypothetical protein
MALSTSHSGAMGFLEAYFCPACTSIQPNSLELAAFPVSAIVALDQLRRLLLLLGVELIRRALHDSIRGDRRTDSNLRHREGSYSELSETFGGWAQEGLTGGTVGGAGATDPGQEPLLNGYPASTSLCVRYKRQEWKFRVRTRVHERFAKGQRKLLESVLDCRLFSLVCRAFLWNNWAGGSSE